MEDFVSNARRSFDFLVIEYGFTHGGEHHPLPELGDSYRSVRYDAPHLFIWVHLNLSDVDVLCFVKTDVSGLLPNDRCSFELQELLLHASPGSLDVLAERDCQQEARTGFAHTLQLNANLLKCHCDALLRRDLKLLEVAARQR